MKIKKSAASQVFNETPCMLIKISFLQRKEIVFGLSGQNGQLRKLVREIEHF